MRCIWWAMYRHVLIVLKTFSWFQFIFSLPFPYSASDATSLTPSIPHCYDEGSNLHHPATPRSSYRRLREQAHEEPPDEMESKFTGFPARKRSNPRQGTGAASAWASGGQGAALAYCTIVLTCPAPPPLGLAPASLSGHQPRRELVTFHAGMRCITQAALSRRLRNAFQNLVVKNQMPFRRGKGRRVPGHRPPLLPVRRCPKSGAAGVHQPGQRREEQTDIPASEIPPAQEKRPQLDLGLMS